METKDKLKKRRLQLGMTIEDVARLVGVSNATVSRWETGDIENMRRDKIALLAKALQVTPSYIMGWDEEENATDTDEDILVISRAAKKMTPEQREEMMTILKIAFKEEFK